VSGQLICLEALPPGRDPDINRIGVGWTSEPATQDKSLLPLPGIEPWFSGRQSRSLSLHGLTVVSSFSSHALSNKLSVQINKKFWALRFQTLGRYDPAQSKDPLSVSGVKHADGHDCPLYFDSMNFVQIRHKDWYETVLNVLTLQTWQQCKTLKLYLTNSKYLECILEEITNINGSLRCIINIL
jgi:hypothetical protein